MLLVFPNQPFLFAAVFLAIETYIIKTMNSIHFKKNYEIVIHFRGM